MNPSTDEIEKTLGLTQDSKKSYKKYIWIISFFILLFIGIFFYKFYTDSGNEVVYKSAPVELKTITTTVLATGNLEPTNSVDVGIEVSGTIKEVLVDYNSRVKVGEIMARLDTTKLASAVESSKAALLRYKANAAEAKASLVYAQNEWERVDKMYTATKGNYPSKKEVDEAYASLQKAKAVHDAALAQTRQASAELASNEDDLRKAIVVSPIDGIVLDRKIEPGQTVVASMETPILFTMAKDLTKMKVILSVDEADIGEVKEGQKVEFNVDAYPEKKFHGIITQIRLNSEIINGVVTYNTVVEVDNSDLLLHPGMTVSASITTAILDSVLSVPNAALRFTPAAEQKIGNKSIRSKTQSVWILRQNEPLKVEVKTGKSDGTSTYITDTSLTTNDSVLIGIEKQ
ncbi:efflux RND transporter periplasmic adaptor subunit [Sulfurimonas xiamenensis]|jgi:HlyD family secretion protein|uniref:Efflux RND transporter periplasmic adaptor subunit n=1 Tax=Sulfurimonas xiamenensis TaxID=2590021 RepID=A0AAJ4A231_9BACT|nr:efflux RND transporter periplasmic adaptor subunit [Sulfurimonas xiamenensis]PLY16155.1 MAG: efflux RND transporter periplasmic adaptor subunit [Sulfurimonas sp.]QFR42493.1 efflux RND transporter periplasmic adaptor subunit [Sulfurimonas xiamenensis]